jgi:hypothetical protein
MSRRKAGRRAGHGERQKEIISPQRREGHKENWARTGLRPLDFAHGFARDFKQDKNLKGFRGGGQEKVSTEWWKEKA